MNTDNGYLIRESEAEHKFVLSGDLIIAYGDHFVFAHVRSLYTFDMRSLTEQYNIQVIQLGKKQLTD